MDRAEGVSRRTALKAAGAGFGLALAGCQMGGKAPKPKRAPGSPFARADFHHLGLPTKTKHEKERFLEDAKVYITDPDTTPYHIEWCRWMPDSEAPEKLRTETHIAFQVDDVDAEIAKFAEKDVFAKPFVPFEGLKVGFVLYEGTLIEFLQKTA